MRVPEMPERLQWDHNAHYHSWLQRQLPARADRVLDVGCGSGRGLASRAARVDALDRCPAMIAAATRRCPRVRNVRWLEGDLLDGSVPLAADGYDGIVALSSLHHMPLEPALKRLGSLLRPGGVLAVVGHYRPHTATDLALALVGVPANVAVGVGLALRGRAGKPDDLDMPMLVASETLVEIRVTARRRLPGAIVRRALFWRYLLTWRRP